MKILITEITRAPPYQRIKHVEQNLFIKLYILRLIITGLQHEIVC